MNNCVPLPKIETNKQNPLRSHGGPHKPPHSKGKPFDPYYLELQLHRGGALCSSGDMPISQGTGITCRFEWLVTPPCRSGPSNKIFDLLLPYKALSGHEFVVLVTQGRPSPVLHLFPTFLYKYIWVIVYLDLATSSQCLRGSIRWPGSGTNVQETLGPGPSSDVTCPQAWGPSTLSVALGSVRPLWPLTVSREEVCLKGMDPPGGATLKRSLEIGFFTYVLTPEILFLEGVAFFLEKA